MITDGKLSIYLTIQAQLVGQKEMMAAQKKTDINSNEWVFSSTKSDQKVIYDEPMPTQQGRTTRWRPSTTTADS